MSGYKQIRESELKSNTSNFNFSEILQRTTNNDYWMDKQPLWTVISGACNDAAQKYYSNMKEYIQNLCDIDYCNIHALKSMAKSVNAEHLTEFIDEDYPEELLKLINLFSIHRSNIFKKFDLSAVYPEVGAIDSRNVNLNYPKYKITLIYETLNNIDKIVQLFKNNLLPYKELDEITIYDSVAPEYTIRNLVEKTNTDFFEFLGIQFDGTNETKEEILNEEFDIPYYLIDSNSNIPKNFKKKLQYITLFDLQLLLQEINNNDNKNLMDYTTVTYLLEDGKLNPFYILFNLLKTYIINPYTRYCIFNIL